MSGGSTDGRMETRCAHIGCGNDSEGLANGPVVASIAQSTIFDLGASSDADAIFSGERAGFAYSRFGNPTVALLGEAVSQLEGGSGGLVTSSGNAAILCALTMAMAGRKGKLVTHSDIYGGSFELLQILAKTYRLDVEVVDASDTPRWREAVSGAAVVLLETPSNPLMRLIDLNATVEAAKASSASVIVDNTVATPFNQRPFEFGVDWVVHSATKYLNGHSDMVSGCVVKREPLTKQEIGIHKNLGGTVNALDAWLVLRGLRTFALRMAAHNRNGQQVADWLRRRPEVEKVYYPGDPGHEQAEVFRKQMSHGGALLSMELKGGMTAATRFIDRMRLITHAVSLGGMESVATRPGMSSHRGMSAEARSRAGISDGLVRLSVGVESVEDLIEDLDQALTD